MKEIKITEASKYVYEFSADETINFAVSQDCEIVIRAYNSKLNLNFFLTNVTVKIHYLLEDKVNIKQQWQLKNSQLDIRKLCLADRVVINNKIMLDQSTLNLQHKGFVKKRAKGATKIVHQTSNATSQVACLLVGVKGANIDMLLDSHVKKHCRDTVATQKIKVIALNEKINVNMQPILRTDHHQITAQHAAVFSQITADEIYYLQSRGLSEKQAKELIIKSLLLSGNEPYYEKIEELKL